MSSFFVAVAIALLFANQPEQNLQRGTLFFETQSSEQPTAQPPTTLERQDSELPESPILHRGNKLLYGTIAFVIVVGTTLTLIWAFRSGRQNRPVSAPKNPPRKRKR